MVKIVHVKDTTAVKQPRSYESTELKNYFDNIFGLILFCEQTVQSKISNEVSVHLLASAVLERGSSLRHTPLFRYSFQGASLSCSGGKCNLGSGCQLCLGMHLFSRICFSLGSSCPRFRQTICIGCMSNERSCVVQRCVNWGQLIPWRR